MFLVDTNIFLEILLKQDKNNICKAFLDENISLINISDFTLHSIGVILFRHNEEKLFSKFISDTLPETCLISLPRNGYEEVTQIKEEYNLDFDDSYQYCICKKYDLQLVTMDQDFKKAKDIEVVFL